MRKKIKIAVVDDDPSMHDILQDLYFESPIADIRFTYTDSRKFLEEVPFIDFDLCFLDISMPDISGLVLAQLLRKKPIIFITGSEDKLKDALGFEPIDVVTKPFNKERLDHALEKAYKLIGESIEYGVFNVAESERKVKLHVTDIVFADTDEVDPRHKPVVLKDGSKFTIMDCSLEELMSFAPQLVQANRRQLINIDYIKDTEYDLLSVKNADKFKIPAEITLSRKYKKEITKRIFFK